MNNHGNAAGLDEQVSFFFFLQFCVQLNGFNGKFIVAIGFINKNRLISINFHWKLSFFK